MFLSQGWKSLGFDRTKLKQYCDEVYAYAKNIDFFTIESLSKQGFTADLESLGFEPWFYSSILREDHRFSHRKMGGTVLFHAAGQEASIRNLVFSILEQESSVDVDLADCSAQRRLSHSIRPMGYNSTHSKYRIIF